MKRSLVATVIKVKEILWILECVGEQIDIVDTNLYRLSVVAGCICDICRIEPLHAVP
jgi:hypothetical protein